MKRRPSESRSVICSYSGAQVSGERGVAQEAQVPVLRVVQVGDPPSRSERMKLSVIAACWYPSTHATGLGAPGLGGELLAVDEVPVIAGEGDGGAVDDLGLGGAGARLGVLAGGIALRG